MIRLFTLSDIRPTLPVSLSDNQRHYLLHVMRRRVGDEVLIFNGRDGEWSATVRALDKKTGSLMPHTQTRPQTPGKALFLCPALIKKENMDWVFQKATELGVSDIYPLLTEHTVVSHLNEERAVSQLIEAAEQCERLTVPNLHSLQSLRAVLSDLPTGIIPVCLSERGTTTTPLRADQAYAFFIGPEGGWTSDELALFQKFSAVFWHLGDTILRAETAAVAALSCARFCLG